MNPIQKQQQKELEKIEICIDILKNARNELYLSMRFFDVILSGFEFLPDTKISGIGTDGFTVYFYPDYLIGLYQRTPVQVNRAYLHMIFHCLFGHLKQPDHADEQYWNLACDIVVESIIDELNEHSVRKYVPPYRKGVYQKLREKRPNYEVAFVFLKEDYRDVDVPVWAIKLIIEPEELEEKRIE